MATQPDIFVSEPYIHKLPQKQRMAFILNPVLATECIFGFKLAFFQITRLQEAWHKTSFMDCSGYGTGKTFTIALLLALRGILFPNRVQMIVSHTFGGVKLVFDTYLEPWFYEMPNYAQFLPEGTKYPISKTSELYSTKYFNGNEIRGVPPGILTGSTRMRSERCNDIYLDEWAHYHSQEEIDTVIKSRATRYNPFHQIQPTSPEAKLLKNILSNHKAFLSTPNYTSHDSYKRAVYFIQKAHIENHPNYGYESYCYLDLIEDGREDLTDLEAIEESKAMLPTDLFTRDYLGRWVSGSTGYYPDALLQQVRSNLILPLLKGQEKAVYIKGIDVARSIKGKGDDFAISVFQFSHKPGFPHVFVHQITQNNIDADEMAICIHEVDELFPGPMLIMDPGGGGQFLAGPLAKTEFQVSGGIKHVTPILEIDRFDVVGKNILYWFSRSTLAIREIVGTMSGDDVLVNNAHNVLKSYLENKRLLAPLNPDLSVYFNRMLDKDFQTTNRDLAKLTPLEQVHYNIELTMRQLQGVKQKLDRQTGKPVVTARGQFSFTSTRKKDSAYSFLYGVFGLYLYEEMCKRDQVLDSGIGLAVTKELSPEPGDPSEFDYERSKNNEENNEGIYSFASV